jgi:hypothetical protein
VNKRELVNIRGPLEAEAARVIREIPGLTVDLEPAKADVRGDAILQFGDQRAPVAVEFKQQANAAGAWQLVHQAQLYPEAQLLLIAAETTTEARQILEDHGIAIIDGLGNAHIELPGLMFHVEGRGQPRGATKPAPPTRLSGKAGVAAQALLLEPNRDWTVQDLAARAGIAAGFAHRVLTRLETEGVVTAEGAGPRRVRRVTNPTALLDLWAEEQRDRPERVNGYLLAQTPRQLVERLGANLGRANIDYALTGAAAASLVAPFVTALPVAEVWVAATAAPDELHRAAQTSPVAEGQNVVFLQAKDDAPLAFREETNNVRIANRFRLYADLQREPRRGREQADHLREEVIGF